MTVALTPPTKDDKKQYKALKKILKAAPYDIGGRVCALVADEETSLWTAQKLIEYVDDLEKQDKVARKEYQLSHTFSKKDPSSERLTMLLDAGFTLNEHSTSHKEFADRASLRSIKLICQHQGSRRAMENPSHVSGLFDSFFRAGKLDVCAYLVAEHQAKPPHDFAERISHSKNLGDFEKYFDVFMNSDASSGLDIGDALMIATRSKNSKLNEKIFTLIAKKPPIPLDGIYSIGIRSTPEDLEYLCDQAKNYGCEANLAKPLSLMAIKFGYIQQFESLYDIADGWTEKETLDLISAAIPNKSFVEIILSKCQQFTGEVAFSARHYDFLKADSHKLIEAVSQTKNGRAYIEKAINFLLNRSDCFNKDHFLSCMNAMSPSQKEMSGFLKLAVKSNIDSAVDLMLANDLDVSCLTSEETDTIVQSASLAMLEKLLNQGFVIGSRYAALTANIYDRDKQSLLDAAHKREQNELYPKWEIQDDNTVAELSLVRNLGKSSFVLLRRSFNFRAGTVDQTQETHHSTEGVSLIPGNSLSMGEVAPEMVECAREQLSKKGGNPYPYSSGHNKKASPLKIAKK